MKRFLIQFANEDNPKEIVDTDELKRIEKSLEDFDGFNPLTIKCEITQADLKSLKQFFTKIDRDIQKVTGWSTVGEWEAYEKGRRDEEKVLLKWIEDWDGDINSGMGCILTEKYNILRKQKCGYTEIKN